MDETHTEHLLVEEQNPAAQSASTTPPNETETPSPDEQSSQNLQEPRELAAENPKNFSRSVMEFHPRWSILSNAETDVSSEWIIDPNSFINVSIIDYEKHDGSTVSNSFVTYGIQTKTNWPVFSTQEFTVRRRYNDFLWLRSQLQKVFPTVFVPPIPEKQVSADRFSPEFIAKRKRMLRRFLSKVAQHPKLRYFVDLHIFLEAKSWALETLKQSRVSDLPDSSVTQTKRPSFKSKKIRRQSPQFSDMGAYINEFEDQITQLEQFCLGMQKAKKDLAQSYYGFGAMLTLLSNTEVELADSFACAGGIVELSGKYLEQEVRSDEENFQEILHMYVLYLDGIQEIIRRRNACYAFLEEMGIELQSLKPSSPAPTQNTEKWQVLEDETTLGENDEEISEQPSEAASQTTPMSPPKSQNWFRRLFQRETDSSDESGAAPTRSAKDMDYIVQLELRIQQAQIEQERMDAELLQEYNLFHEKKVDDFKKMLDIYSKCQASHHRDAMEAWTKLPAVLDRVKKIG